MKYEIIGKDKRFGKKECYGRFDNLRDAISYLNFLKKGTLGTIINFKLMEVE